MHRTADDADARAEFAREIQEVMSKAARSGRSKPTLQKIAKASQGLERPALTTSSISAWRKGERLPSSPAALEAFLTALERAASLPRGQLDRHRLKSLYGRARSTRAVALDSRVAVFPVRDADPLELKVHRARTLDDGNAVPAYIPRDVDTGVREALTRLGTDGGVVLLVGASTAGKTRCAYEAMTSALPDHLLVVPPHITDLPAAVTECVRAGRSGSPSVLWLNDLEQYLGPHGLTLNDIRALRRARTVVLATMRTRIRADLPSHELVRLAEEFEVKRLWSASEIERAREHLRARPDKRLRLALEQAEDFGVAEALATGPQLWRELRSASVVDGNPRGAALVWAAIDLALAGLAEPQSVELLQTLHERYLPGRNKQLIAPESFESALSWATSPRDAVTRLLIPEGEGLRPFDYLLDAHLRDREPSPDLIPDEIWEIALGRGLEKHQRFSIALAAHANDRMDIGLRALQPLADAGDVDTFRTLGLMYERSDQAAAIHWLQRAIDAEDTLSLRLMGNLHFRAQDVETAHEWYAQAAEAGDEVSQSYYTYPDVDARRIPDELAPPADPRPSLDEEGWEEKEEEADWGPSARTLRLLEDTLSMLADLAYDVIEEIGDHVVDLGDNYTSLFSRLPVATWRQNAQWRRQMARCFDDLAMDIKAGRWPRPTCTGEEMALHIAIDYASSTLVEEPDLVTELVEGVPPHHADWDWHLCIDVLFEDTDVLFLYEPWAQGIEDSEHHINQRMGLANLEAEDWFKPFYEDAARPQDRGFRR
ncbi:sel1 repeat family protein [Streptomyces sp. SID10815]|uniref:tetratricopeptide repeat protein n=1 Tax=Streptomyces sp. SID10815 TaxID=2706027 RepID=UPI0013C7973A|nr:sel1 repeat family protein [Streptomyces sp. SID10815]NEA46324.1 sel1 repeat family protein [Streptomyces sp. SID10815]